MVAFKQACCVVLEDTFFSDTIKDMLISMVLWKIKEFS
jgi:hypothetical protein